MDASDPNNPLAIVTEAAIRASIAEGKDLLTDAMSAGWTKLRALLRRCSGKERTEVDEAIDDVIAKPDKDGRHDDLAKEVRTAADNLDAEVIQAAQDLIEMFNKNPGTEQRPSSVVRIIRDISDSQIVGDVSGGQVMTNVSGPAVQKTGPGDVVIGQSQKKTRSRSDR
jgi:hypothetical protein